MLLAEPLHLLTQLALAWPLAFSCMSSLCRWLQAAIGHLRALLHIGMRMPAREALEAAVRPTETAGAGDPVRLP